MEVFANQPAVQDKATERGMVPIEKLSEFWPRILAVSPAIRAFRQFDLRKTKCYRENHENVSHMEIKRGIKVQSIKPLPVKC